MTSWQQMVLEKHHNQEPLTPLERFVVAHLLVREHRRKEQHQSFASWLRRLFRWKRAA